MAAVRSLLAGHTKFVILTTPPADPAAPTLTELTAGVDASCRVKGSNFVAGPADSETVDSDLLCEDIKGQAYGQSNYTLEFSPYRYFDATTGQADTSTGGEVGDQVFQLLKEKGTKLYYYIRRNGKKSKDDFVAGDEVLYLAGTNDWPQQSTDDGYISVDVKVLVDEAEPNAAVAAGV